MASNKRIEVHKTEDALIKRLCEYIENISKKAIEERSAFTIGVSGGSLIGALAKGLPGVKTEWSKWKIYFCDERIVPFDDTESTYGAYKKALDGVVPIKDDQYRKIDPKLSAEEAAKDYIGKLKADFGNVQLPRFDLLLLGMGPDGHTCSLFPGHPLLQETSVWVAPITDSPKPPPSRVTLTFPVINNAATSIFTIWGAGKADMIKRVLADKEDLPVNQVSPKNGLVHWLLDDAAATKLNGL
ncbi:unnamed protein product [Bemisia tabaci]|uniref:6-phosphogluconolactonase n=1 Tax=Bemisia tabaci TaxID=7038 RepID=A0A9P0F0B8_BEMTA|nr:unnamed protein product [Bemisia tabaci]